MALNNSQAGRVIIDPVVLANYLRSPNGPVTELLIRRATRVQEAAVNQIRLGSVRGGGRPNLRSTVLKRVLPDPAAGGAPMVRVGSDSPIALLHHEGTRPHIIRPRNTAYLKFFSNRSNDYVFAKVVHHPGTKPNRFLTDNIHLALSD